MTQTALITGSAKRIGREIALFLAEKEYDIALHYHHSKEEAEQTKKDIEKLGRKVTLFQANLLEDDETNSLIKKVFSQCNNVTCLINNASIYQDDTFESFNRTSWDKHFTSHGFAPLLLAQQFAAHLPENVKGNILNISDSATIRPRREALFTYQLSKSLLNTATELVATQLPSNIRINTLASGTVLKNEKESKEYFERIQKNCPLEHGASVEDLLQAVGYLLNAKSVTGVTLPVDGGKWVK